MTDARAAMTRPGGKAAYVYESAMIRAPAAPTRILALRRNVGLRKRPTKGGNAS